jgi:ESCRT-I complex subunit TSG101
MIVDISIKDSRSLHNSASNSHSTLNSDPKYSNSRRASRRNNRHLTCCRIHSKSLCRQVQVPVSLRLRYPHLLQAISTSLVQQAQQKVQQNLSAIAPLQAQQQALRAAYARLENERSQLENLDATLSSNESILRRSIQDCNHVISEAKSKKQPPIDEVLVAPTLVAQQLWTLTAEEAACREAMYVLQKAVDRGRISGNDFVRQMRGLGRESFLKMVLARKCAKGLGLEVDR